MVYYGILLGVSVKQRIHSSLTFPADVWMLYQIRNFFPLRKREADQMRAIGIETVSSNSQLRQVAVAKEETAEWGKLSD